MAEWHSIVFITTAFLSPRLVMGPVPFLLPGARRPHFPLTPGHLAQEDPLFLGLCRHCFAGA